VPTWTGQLLNTPILSNSFVLSNTITNYEHNLIGNFYTLPNYLPNTLVLPGVWELNIWASVQQQYFDNVFMYMKLYYTDQNGENAQLITDASNILVRINYSLDIIKYDLSLYTNSVELPDKSYRLLLQLWYLC
jgi:hypothetical protein